MSLLPQQLLESLNNDMMINLERYQQAVTLNNTAVALAMQLHDYRRESQLLSDAIDAMKTSLPGKDENLDPSGRNEHIARHYQAARQRLLANRRSDKKKVSHAPPLEDLRDIKVLIGHALPTGIPILIRLPEIVGETSPQAAAVTLQTACLLYNHGASMLAWRERSSVRRQGRQMLKLGQCVLRSLPPDQLEVWLLLALLQKLLASSAEDPSQAQRAHDKFGHLLRVIHELEAMEAQAKVLAPAA